MTLDRRSFLAGTAGATATLLGACAAPTSTTPLPATAAAARSLAGPAPLPFMVGQPDRTMQEICPFSRRIRPAAVDTAWLAMTVDIDRQDETSTWTDDQDHVIEQQQIDDNERREELVSENFKWAQLKFNDLFS